MLRLQRGTKSPGAPSFRSLIAEGWEATNFNPTIFAQLPFAENNLPAAHTTLAASSPSIWTLRFPAWLRHQAPPIALIPSSVRIRGIPRS
jgi:hypothetical protein